MAATRFSLPDRQGPDPDTRVVDASALQAQWENEDEAPQLHAVDSLEASGEGPPSHPLIQAAQGLPVSQQSKVDRTELIVMDHWPALPEAFADDDDEAGVRIIRMKESCTRIVAADSIERPGESVERSGRSAELPPTREVAPAAAESVEALEEDIIQLDEADLMLIPMPTPVFQVSDEMLQASAPAPKKRVDMQEVLLGVLLSCGVLAWLFATL